MNRPRQAEQKNQTRRGKLQSDPKKALYWQIEPQGQKGEWSRHQEDEVHVTRGDFLCLSVQFAPQLQVAKYARINESTNQSIKPKSRGLSLYHTLYRTSSFSIRHLTIEGASSVGLQNIADEMILTVGSCIAVTESKLGVEEKATLIQMVPSL